MWGQLLFISLVGLFVYTQLSKSPLVDSPTKKETPKKKKSAKKAASNSSLSTSSLPLASFSDANHSMEELDIRATGLQQQHHHQNEDEEQAMKRLILEMLQRQDHEDEQEFGLHDEHDPLDRHFFNQGHAYDSEQGDHDDHPLYDDLDMSMGMGMDMDMESANNPIIQQQLAAMIQSYMASVKKDKPTIMHQTVTQGEEGEDDAWSDMDDEHDMPILTEDNLAFLTHLMSKSTRA